MIVHSAGVFEKAPAPEVTPHHWQQVMDINLSAVMALTSAGWEALAASGGQIVLISSIAAVQAFEGNAAYAASKGGLNALGEVLRLEGRGRGIRVITVCPAQTDTELWIGKAPDRVRARMMPRRRRGRAGGKPGGHRPPHRHRSCRDPPGEGPLGRDRAVSTERPRAGART